MISRKLLTILVKSYIVFIIKLKGICVSMIKQFKETKTAKIKNMQYLYRIIRKHGQITKKELIESTGWTQTTCTRSINHLLEEQLIIESGFAESNGGRKPVVYEINATAFYSIGIDISRTFTKVLLLDMNLDVKGEARFPMDKDSTPEITITFIQHAIKKGNVKRRQLLGIRIGSVEPLDREKGIIAEPINFTAPHWKDVPIVARLETLFPTKILLDKGVNTAVLAEHGIGLNNTVENLNYVIAGMGIRLGVMTNNELFQGFADRYEKYGNGHMIVNTNGRKCVCGGYGCVHTYSTIPALKAEVVAQLKSGHSSILMEKVNIPEEINFEAICWALKYQDPMCSEIIKNFGYYTGIAISNMISLFHPDLLILGGPMYNRLDLFYETVMQTSTARINQLYPGYQVNFSRGYLGEKATAIGAASMIMAYYLE